MLRAPRMHMRHVSRIAEELFWGALCPDDFVFISPLHANSGPLDWKYSAAVDGSSQRSYVASAVASHHDALGT